MEECVIRSPADHSLITWSPMKGDCMFLICISTLKNPNILLHPWNLDSSRIESEWKRGFMILIFLIIYCDNSNEAAYDL
ncbi:hypothetical protein Q3G72_027367 [Acer saccharum]|nr:hypothetical protein Q3G72_027367 [Acer saccharum]